MSESMKKTCGSKEIEKITVNATSKDTFEKMLNGGIVAMGGNITADGGNGTDGGGNHSRSHIYGCRNFGVRIKEIKICTYVLSI